MPNELQIEITEWQNEDTMTEESMYDALFPLSKVDFVRMFPKKIVVSTRAPKPVDEEIDKLISPFVAGEQKKEILEALSHYTLKAVEMSEKQRLPTAICPRCKQFAFKIYKDNVGEDNAHQCCNCQNIFYPPDDTHKPIEDKFCGIPMSSKDVGAKLNSYGYYKTPKSIELPERKKYDYEGGGDDSRDDWSYGFNQCLGLVRETLKAQGVMVKKGDSDVL